MANDLTYPLTKMNFIVSVESVTGIAAFTEVTGIDSTVDVIEFRQGNSAFLSPMKIPGLVKHGNLTLKLGYTMSSTFKNWVWECVKETGRGAIASIQRKVTIELVNTVSAATPSATLTAPSGATTTWILDGAWVAKYQGPDLNASTSEVAIETIEIAYEQMTQIAN